MITGRHNIPIWIPIAMFAGFLVFAFTTPDVMEESDQIVVFETIPFSWLFVPIALHLFLGSIGLRIYEWSEFGDHERRQFLNRILLLSLVEIFSWFGSYPLAAYFSWTYDIGFLIAIILPTLLILFWHFNKPRKELWE